MLEIGGEQMIFVIIVAVIRRQSEVETYNYVENS